LILVPVGLALLVAPWLWSDDPVSLDEKVELARAARRRTGGVGVSVSAVPLPGGQGGQLVFAGRF